MPPAHAIDHDADTVPGDRAVDALLASVLRGEEAFWPSGSGGGSRTTALVVERITYHGVAAIIADREQLLRDWPGEVLRFVRTRAIGTAMRELRHQHELGEATGALAAAGVRSVLLKGSALAYSVYVTPAWRERGDSDLLVNPADREAARRVLADLGYARDTQDDERSGFLGQENWTRTATDGTEHLIDLHFTPFNSPALAKRIGAADAFRDSRALPRIGPDAAAPSLAFLLFHGCVHRAIHAIAPYFAAGRRWFGAGRLIWLLDIDLLARAMTDGDWAAFVELAIEKQNTGACLAGLTDAERDLGTAIPEATLAALRTAARGRAWVDRGQLGRALLDIGAIKGASRRLGYAVAKLVPSRAFIRDKYPHMGRVPLPLLHLRRLVELVLPRPRHTDRRRR